jgi:hypothetical protein
MQYAKALQSVERYATSLPSQTSAEIDAVAKEIGPLTDKLLALEPRIRRNALRGLAPDRTLSKLSGLIDAATRLSATLRRCR